MFIHSGYPRSVAVQKYRLYALFDPRHDCFIYVNHNLSVIRSVQALMSSKAPLWLYELWVPAATPKTTITNTNCDSWTLPVGAPRPEITFFQLHFEDIKIIDCTEVNSLGQMAGLDLKDNVTGESTLLKNYAIMVGWFCQHLCTIESTADDMISRVAILDKVYQKTDIFDADVYLFISEIYKILMLSLTEQEVKQKIIVLMSKFDSVVLVNKFSKQRLGFLKTLVDQWQQSS